MLADCMEGDRQFGLIFLPENTEERELQSGRVGCVASIVSAEQLPDGRSNILVAGEERFTFRRFVESPHPYHVAEVGGYDDEPEESEALDALGAEVRALFERVAVAARALTDDRSPVPELPEDPALLAFRIASLIDTTATMRYELLESRSALGRLHEIRRLLAAAVDSLEARAGMHQRARRNGRGYQMEPGSPP
jgi:Lon protease-like protein